MCHNVSYALEFEVKSPIILTLESRFFVGLLLPFNDKKIPNVKNSIEDSCEKYAPKSADFDQIISEISIFRNRFHKVVNI
jgi:hypothetical protein